MKQQEKLQRGQPAKEHVGGCKNKLTQRHKVAVSTNQIMWSSLGIFLSSTTRPCNLCTEGRMCKGAVYLGCSHPSEKCFHSSESTNETSFSARRNYPEWNQFLCCHHPAVFSHSLFCILKWCKAFNCTGEFKYGSPDSTSSFQGFCSLAITPQWRLEELSARYTVQVRKEQRLQIEGRHLAQKSNILHFCGP